MNVKKPRIVVGEFHQETNSFNHEIWSFERFRQDVVLEGDAILERYRNLRGSVVGGMIDAAEAAGAEVFPSSIFHAVSGGPVDFEVARYFVKTVAECYERNKPIDALLLCLHGATQSVEMDDVSGWILEQLRRQVGDEVIISVGCDLHANVTKRWMDHADFICGYQTYPHIDHYNTGVRAVRLAFDKLLLEKKRYMARIELPMIVPASGYSTKDGIFAEIMNYGHDLVKSEELIDFSVFQMQPWLDVSPAASVVLAVAETKEAALKYADVIANRVFESRDLFWPEIFPVHEIIERARTTPKGKATILVDFADSVGGGAFGDSTAVLLKLMEENYPVSAAIPINDPKSVHRAEEVGVGNEAEFLIGAGFTPDMLGPVKVTARVIGIYDGIFVQEGPVGAGLRRNIGKTAVLRTKNIDILICEHLCGMGDIQIYRTFGIEPANYDLVVVKANTSFRASYEKVAHEIYMAKTPGLGTADLCSLKYEHLPEKFYPFDSLNEYEVGQPEIYVR